MLNQSKLNNILLLPLAMFAHTLIYINYLDTIDWQNTALLFIFFILTGTLESTLTEKINKTNYFLPPKSIFYNLVLIALLLFLSYQTTWLIIIPGIIYLLLIQYQYIFYHYQMIKLGHTIVSFLKSYIPIFILFYLHLDFFPLTIIRLSLIYFIPHFLNTWNVYHIIAKINDLEISFYKLTTLNKYTHPLMMLSVLVAALLSYFTISWYSLLYILLLFVYFYQKKKNLNKSMRLTFYTISYASLGCLAWYLALL